MIRPRIGETIVRCGTVTTTMDEARLLADAGACDGTVVVADHQTAGRGRAGRAWVERPGDGLLMSVVLRPAIEPARLSVLPLLVGVAVAEGLEAVVPVSCQLKWPNDVWIEGRKVAGILVTTHRAGGATTVIAGIGVNVNTPLERLTDTAISLSVASGGSIHRESLLEAIVSCLNAHYGHFVASGGSADLAAWRDRAALTGELVRVVQGGETLTGRYRGIDDDGALILEIPGGKRRRVVAGDLVRGPVAAR